MTVPAFRPSRLRWSWAVGLLLVLALYLPGLGGGFVLDDMANLATLEGYLQGQLRWQAVVFGNESGLLGRPLAMASFVLNAIPAGIAPMPFKLVNLLLHLGCAVLVALLTRAVLASLHVSRERARALSLATSLLWAVLPVHVSTVLYVVQRMALLSSLFSLLALWL